jgi:hypothetical protein
VPEEQDTTANISEPLTAAMATTGILERNTMPPSENDACDFMND